MKNNKKRIAIIGSGISGLSSAYFLKDKYDITIYEKNDRLGGHSRTIEIFGNNHPKILVDTGFIVLNDRTYPHLNDLFQKIGVEIVETEMSFAISANNGELEWSGTSLNSLFAQRKNIINLNMLKGIYDVFKFNKKAVSVVNDSPNLTLAELIDHMNLGDWFKEYYILPMGAAIWSCPYNAMMNFPAATFVKFFDNHGLLNITNRPVWYSLKDKSISYVKILEDLILKKGRIFKNSSIDYIKRSGTGVEVKTSDKNIEIYENVIFACHATEILDLLADINEQEKTILSKFDKQKNTAYTHSDINQMPKLKRCWSSWNYLYHNSNKVQNVSVSYWMNKLQHINESTPLFVTLNPISTIAENKIYDKYDFYHPVFDQKAIEAQKEINLIQGNNKIWFCGAYLRYGFHEDGIWSAVNIVNKIGEKS